MMPARARRSTCCSAALVELIRNTGPLQSAHHNTHCSQTDLHTTTTTTRGNHNRAIWRWSGKERAEKITERGGERESREERIIVMIERDHHTHSFCFYLRVRQTTSHNCRTRREKCLFKPGRSITGWNGVSVGSRKGLMCYWMSQREQIEIPSICQSVWASETGMVDNKSTNDSAESSKPSS